MSINFASPVNLLQNELQNARVQNLATDPSTPVSGQIWYNSTAGQLKIYDGTAARVLLNSTSTLNTLNPPTASVSFGGQTITNLGAPVNATDAASKSYVDGVAAGLDVKASVVAATTTNGTLSTSFAAGQVIDGVTLAAGNRILLKNQTTASQNGIYVVQSSGAPVRSSDCNTSATYTTGAFTFVEQGTVNAGAAFVVSTQGTITPDTTAVTWVQFSAAITYSAGSGLTLTGTTFSVNVSGNTVEIASNALRVKSGSTSGQPLLSGATGTEPAYGPLSLATSTSVTGALPIANGGTGATTATAARAALGAVGKAVATIGDGSSTTIKVTHNLGTSAVVVQTNYAASPFQEVNVETQITDANNVTFLFGTAPAANSISVVVIG